MANELRILASIIIDTGLSGDQSVDLSAFPEYVLSDAIFDTPTGLASQVNVGLFTGANRTGTSIFQKQPGTAGSRFALAACPVLSQSMLYINLNHPAAGSLVVHLIGTDVP